MRGQRLNRLIELFVLGAWGGTFVGIIAADAKLGWRHLLYPGIVTLVAVIIVLFRGRRQQDEDWSAANRRAWEQEHPDWRDWE